MNHGIDGLVGQRTLQELRVTYIAFDGDDRRT